MRADDLLEETDLPYAAVAFNNPPGYSYAVYNEEITRRGADTMNCITEYDVSIEVYAYDFYDDAAVRAVERAFDRNAIAYKRYDTTYINSEHLYCTRFEYDFVEKDGIGKRSQSEFDDF